MGTWIWETGNVIDGDGIDRILGPSVYDLEHGAATHVFFAEVVEDHVMNAPARTRERRLSRPIWGVPNGCHLDSAPGMRYTYVADGDVGHLAQRTDEGPEPALGGLILRGEQNGITGLAKTSPAVFHNIRLDQHSSRILEFKVILDDERMTVRSAHEVRAALHPLQGLPEVILQDLDFGRGSRSRSAAEQDGLTRGFQEIPLDLEGTVLGVAVAAGDRMGVRTSPCPGDAVEIVEVGIDDRHVAHAI